MHAAAVYLTSALALAGQFDGQDRAAAQQPNVVRGIVYILEEREVPAPEPGQLLSVEFREGDYVDKGTLLGTIDDRDAQAQRDVVQFELDAAQAEADNDVNIRFARESRNVAKFEYLRAYNANKKAPGAVSDSELAQLYFQHSRAKLQIEQAEHELEVAKLTARAGQARLKQAELAIERRQITAPISGMIVTVFNKNGDWVEQGEPVMHIVFLERLLVKGRIDSRAYSYSELIDRPVTAELELARGRREQFTGKIVFANPQINDSLTFEVWAEVDNRMENGHWLLEPGREGLLTIDVGNAAADGARPAVGQQPGSDALELR